MPTDNECVAEAHREAAHAVVACHVGAWFASANVKTEEDGASRVLGGMLKRVADQALQDMPMEALQNRVKVALAGGAAESIVQGRQEPDWERLSMTEQQAVLIFLSPLTTNPRNFDTLYYRFWKEARLLVQRQWPNVEEVAAALLDRGMLQKAEVQAIL